MLGHDRAVRVAVSIAPTDRLVRVHHRGGVGTSAHHPRRQGLPDAIKVDTPASIASFFALFSLLAMFLSLPVFADVALRDAETRMGPLIQAKPVSAAVQVAGRFLGACMVACLVFIGLALGLSAWRRMWWIAAEAVGPFRVEAYALALAVVAIPNLLVDRSALLRRQHVDTQPARHSPFRRSRLSVSTSVRWSCSASWNTGRLRRWLTRSASLP